VKRRIFLKGVGGAALAAPFLSSLQRPASAAAAATPRRMVIFYTQNGCLTNRWFPTVEDGPLTAANLTGTTLEGLSPFAAKLLFPRGLAMFPRGNVTVNGTSYFDPHDQGMGTKLTCAPIDSVGEHWALGQSLDHYAAGLVNPAGNGPLVLSVGNSFANVKGIASYTAAQEPYSPETRPMNVYNSLTGLFTGGGGEPTEGDYRVAQGNSIIDLVRDDLDTFKRLNMSGADQQRVDDWLSLLRETEIQVVSAACNAETATSLGITEDTVSEANGGGGFGGGSSGTAFTLGGDMMIKLIALNMMCDANRSILLQWPGFVTFNWDEIVHEYDHHGLSHRNGSAAVGGTCVSGVIDQIAQIDNWYAGRYVKLVTLIDSIVEGEGTMLDNSAVIWVPELADGNAHNNNNLPVVIAGSAGGYLRTGVSVNLDTRELGTGNSEASCVGGSDVGFGTGSNGGNVPINKLYVTLLNALGASNAGAPITTFGVADSNDVEAGITNPGELSELRA
jgi:hypothetical protein